MDAKAKLSDWIDIFYTGKHTDSGGNTRKWTRADLDSVVANFGEGSRAPHVIGHPKMDSPAWGWVEDVRRVGDKLQARGKDFAEEFLGLVDDRRFTDRSVRFRSDGKGGWALKHIGWLGAKEPALKGLAPAFAEAEGESDALDYSFAVSDFGKGAWNIHRIQRLFRGVREYLLTDKGTEVADKVVPEYELEGMTRDALDAERAEERREAMAASGSLVPSGIINESAVVGFAEGDMGSPQASHADYNSALPGSPHASQPTTTRRSQDAEYNSGLPGSALPQQDLSTQGNDMTDKTNGAHGHALPPHAHAISGTGDQSHSFSRADLDAAVAAAQSASDKRVADLQAELDAQRAQQQQAEFAAKVGTYVEAGKLTPAQAQGAAEFCLAISAGGEFSFAADGGAEQKRKPTDWLFALLDALPKQVVLGESGEFGAADFAKDDPKAVAGKAREYQAAQDAIGNRVSLTEAVNHITRGVN